MSKKTMIRPNNPGIPNKLTRNKVMILMGIKIFAELNIKFKPYNTTNAKHIFFTTFIIFFAIFNHT